MDDVDLRIAAMEKELAELRRVINALGERLGQGENAVHADLNPAIRRERELSSELHHLKVSSGRLTPEDLMMVQVMYGPPSQFSTRNEAPPAPMYPTANRIQATCRPAGRGSRQTRRYWQASSNLATAVPS